MSPLLLGIILLTAESSGNSKMDGESLAMMVDHSNLVALGRVVGGEMAYHTYASGSVVPFLLMEVEVDVAYVGSVDGERVQVAIAVESDLGVARDFDSIVIFATKKAGGALAGYPPEGSTYPVCTDTVVLVQDEYYLGVRDGVLYMPYRDLPACIEGGFVTTCDDGTLVSDLAAEIGVLPKSRESQVEGAP